MSLSLLSLIIFIAVFAGVVFIHEFGHFLVARLLKVDVEEFGFGLPPRALTLWRQAGWLSLKGGQRVEIPGNFAVPFVWSNVLDRDVSLTADQVGTRLVLRTLAFTDTIQPRKAAEAAPAPRDIKVGTSEGAVRLQGEIQELHPGTQFTLNWLPIGGFVRPKGENDPRVPGGLAAASPWVRLGVLFAGPTMNLLLGIAVFSLLFFQMGVPDYTKVQVYEVMANSPASQAGLRPNDVVVAANGKQITDSTQLHDVIYGNLDKPIELSVLRDGKTLTLTTVPSSKRPQGEGALGISMGWALIPSGSVIESVKYGSMAVYEQARLLVTLPAQLLRGNANPQTSRFIGIKGIYDLFGQAVSRDVQSREPTAPSPAGRPQAPTYFTLELIGVLTISLGVLNLVPFPALDGGRILFVLPELLLRRRIPPEWENGINAVGMALLLLFMLYVNVMDFVNPAIVNLPK